MTQTKWIETFTLPAECQARDCHKRPRTLVLEAIYDPDTGADPTFVARAVCGGCGSKLTAMLEQRHQQHLDSRPTHCLRCGRELSRSQFEAGTDALCKVCSDVAAGLRCEQCEAPIDSCTCPEVVAH